MAARAAELAVKLAAGTSPEETEILVDTRLVPRQTTGPVRADRRVGP